MDSSPSWTQLNNFWFLIIMRPRHFLLQRMKHAGLSCQAHGKVVVPEASKMWDCSGHFGRVSPFNILYKRSFSLYSALRYIGISQDTIPPKWPLIWSSFCPLRPIHCKSLMFDIAPEKWWLEDYFPFGMVTLIKSYVKLRGYTPYFCSPCT